MAGSQGSQAQGFRNNNQPLPQTTINQGLIRGQNQRKVAEQHSALDRRLSMMGGGPSGASIQAHRDVEREGAQDLEANNLKLYAHDLEQQMGSQEARMARKHQTKERLGSERHQASERQGSERFLGGQASLERQQKGEFFGKEHGLKMKELELTHDKFKADKLNSGFNKIVAADALKNPYAALRAIVEDPNEDDSVRSAALLSINTNPWTTEGQKGFSYDKANGKWIYAGRDFNADDKNFYNSSEGQYPAMAWNKNGRPGVPNPDYHRPPEANRWGPPQAAAISSNAGPLGLGRRHH